MIGRYPKLKLILVHIPFDTSEMFGDLKYDLATLQTFAKVPKHSNNVVILYGLDFNYLNGRIKCNHLTQI